MSYMSKDEFQSLVFQHSLKPIIEEISHEIIGVYGYFSDFSDRLDEFQDVFGSVRTVCGYLPSDSRSDKPVVYWIYPPYSYLHGLGFTV